MSVNKYNSTTGELEIISGGTLYADAPIGAIQAYGGTTAPSGWLLCQGQAVSRTEYADLFSAIGTAFGEGDGSTTFNVPDLREAVPVGTGTRENDTSRHDIYDIGTFKDDRYASHNHTINHGHSATSTMTYKGSGSSGGSATVSYSVLQNTNGSNPVTTNSIGSTYNITTTVNNYTGSSGNSGDGTVTHGKQLGVNYIIKAKQVAVPFDVAEYIRNQNVLSEYENITLPVSSVPYDGLLTVSVSNGGYVSFSINSRNFTIGSASGTSDTSEITLKKGVNVGFLEAGGTYGIYIRYYKLRDYTGR